MINLKQQHINSDTISRASLSYMEKTFDGWRHSFSDDKDYNYLNYLYMITYFSETLDPLKLMEQFRRNNMTLIHNITNTKCSFYDYLPHQHTGIYFVDCKYSRNGYIADMTGLHIHFVGVVHPNWHDSFTNVFKGVEEDRMDALSLTEWAEELGRAPKNGLRLKKIKPIEVDALKAISYSGKAVIHDNGIYHERQDFYGMLGPRKQEKEKIVRIKKNKNVIHEIKASSLTLRSPNRIRAPIEY